MKIVISCLAILTSIQVSAQVPILVTPRWVNEHRADANVRVVQVGFMKYDYDKEHIDGAAYLWPTWLAPDSPMGTMNLPDLQKAEEVISGLGVSNGSHVILYFSSGNEVSITARMFLTLENLGLQGSVSVMDGGLEVWKKEGFGVTSKISDVKKGSFKAKNLGLLVGKDYVFNNLKSPSVTIVDARATRFYDGESTGNPRAGHIAGAKNIPYMDLVDQNNVFKPV